MQQLDWFPQKQISFSVPGETDNKHVALNFAIIFLKPYGVIGPLTEWHLCKVLQLLNKQSLLNNFGSANLLHINEIKYLEEIFTAFLMLK